MATETAVDFQLAMTISLVNVVASAGTTSTLTTTTNSAGMINGKWVTAYASANNAATPTTDANTGVVFPSLQPNQCCAIVFGQNTAGTLKMAQGAIIGTIVGVTTTVGGFLDAPQFPGLPDDFMVFAYTLVRTAPSAAAWTAGASSWTASGVSATTFTNCGQLPSRPQVA